MLYLTTVKVASGDPQTIKTYVCLIEATDENAAIRMARRHLPFGVDRDLAEISASGVNKFNFLLVSEENTDPHA